PPAPQVHQLAHQQSRDPSPAQLQLQSHLPVPAQSLEEAGLSFSAKVALPTTSGFEGALSCPCYVPLFPDLIYRQKQPRQRAYGPVPSPYPLCHNHIRDWLQRPAVAPGRTTSVSRPRPDKTDEPIQPALRTTPPNGMAIPTPASDIRHLRMLPDSPGSDQIEGFYIRFDRSDYDVGV